MSKKRNKSPANNNANSNKWESNIVSTELNEENWTYSLAILAENIPEDTETISYINQGILTGLRKRFTSITMDKINQLISEFGNPKSKKGKEAPLNFEICESGKSILDKGEVLPVHLLARFIKWIMLINKIDDLKNIGDTNKKTDGKASKAKKGADKNERAKSSGGKKGSQIAGKKSPEPPSVKPDNKLRKRGDPDPDIQYIDDEPDDGNSRYFVVSGIVDSQLVEALVEIGCIATSVIKITRDIHIPTENVDGREDMQEKVSVSSSKDGDDTEGKYDQQVELLKAFWPKLDLVLNSNKQLLNTPIVTLIAKHLMFPIDKTNEELKNKCSMELFESLAVLLYDLLDLKRQWKNYLDKSKLISLPIKLVESIIDTSRESVKEGALQTGASGESGVDATFEKPDTDYYNYLLQDVPIESTSIYLQMSAMLDQVEITCGDKDPNWKSKTSLSPNGLSEETVEIFRSMTEHLYLPKKDLLDLQASLKLPIDTCHKDKTVGKNIPIHALDSITLRDREIDSKNLGSDGLLGHELKMLVASFRHFDLLRVIPLDDKVTRKRAARLQELLKYLSSVDLSSTEINYAIKIFILENLTLSGVDENGFIRVNNEDGVFQKNIHQVWDDPFMIIDEVAQTIIDDENKSLKKEVSILEKEQESFVLSEPVSNSLKSDHYDGILKSSRMSSRSQSPEQVRSTGRKSSVHFQESDQEELPATTMESQLDIFSLLNEQENESFQSILLDYLLNIRKRSFSEWCFEEFYEPHVLLQIIHKAIYKLPFVDIYNQRRVDGKIVVLHNPYHPDSKLNQQPWNQWLHSNVGFRNYLDFVNDKITDWTRDQEAIYQATLLNKELQTAEVENKEPEVKGKPTKANEKAKKGKPSKSRSRSSSRASSVDETASKELVLILPGSLKAQKIEQDKINKAKEEEELKKELKRQLSAQKKAEKDAAKGLDKSKDNKRPSSKASNKSKTKKTAFDDSAESLEKENLPDIDQDKAEEEYWPFTSYNLGDDLAAFTGNVAHLFPSDGSTVRICKMQKLMGATSVRVSVITAQLHVFTVHIIDPTYAPNVEIDNYEKVLENFENQKNVSYYGASTCTFNDGMTIAASNNGYTGTLVKNESQDAPSQRADEQMVNENPLESPHGTSGDTNELNPKLSSRGVEQKPKMDVVNKPNLILTSPDGVQVRVGYENSNEQENGFHLLIYMSKPTINPIRIQSQTTPQNVVTETARYVSSDGRVISILNNDSIKVLFSDGTIAVAQLSVDSSVSHEENEESKIEKPSVKESPRQKKKTKQSKSASAEMQTPNNAGLSDESKQIINYFRIWTITLSNGEVFKTEADLNSLFLPKPSTTANDVSNEEIPLTEENKDLIDLPEVSKKNTNFKEVQMQESLLVSTATDPSTGETLVTRSDGTLLLVSQDAGIFLAEHSDGTRFTRYFVVEKLQHPRDENGDATKSKVIELILIESKQYPSITIDLTNEKIETRFGSIGSLLSDYTGHHIFKHSDNTEIEYRPDGEIIFTASHNSQMTYLQPDGPFSYVFNATSNIICEIMDSEGTEFVIDVNGDYDVKIQNKNEKASQQQTGDQDTDPEPNEDIKQEKEDEQEQEPDKARPTDSAISMSNDNSNVRKYDQHAPRVFTINSDGSGSELLRYRDIVDTIVNAEIDDDYYHYREELQDSPQITAHTIMHPDYENKPWKYDYSRKAVLPKGLTCRDLKSFPAKEVVVKGPAFAMGIGRGLQINSNPMVLDTVKKQAKNLKQDLWKNPMQFRQFYHYPIIGNDIRNNFVMQLIEYNKKILRQRQLYQDYEIVDNRREEEQILAGQMKEKFESMKYTNKQVMNNALNSLAQSIQIDQFPAVVNPKVTISESTAKKSLNPTQKKLEIILEQQRINKEKEIENKTALKNKIIPKYFTSIYGSGFISCNAMDLQSLNKSMKLFPTSRDGTSYKAFDSSKNQDDKVADDNDIDSARWAGEDSLPNLVNDFIEENTKDKLNDKSSLSARNLIIKKKEKKYIYYDSTLFIPNAPKRIPVSSNLSLPKYLYSERPAIEPNIRQAMIEDPVRRKMYTTSLIGGSNVGQIFQRQTRGLNVLPARVDTGLLREGQNYVFKIKLINTGPESACFKVKQPPSTAGIWIEFLPGPIAAGLSRRITIHIYAIANNPDANNSSVSIIEHPLQITTNTDRLVIPIIGRVMPADKYDAIYPPSNINASIVSELVPDSKDNRPVISTILNKA